MKNVFFVEPDELEKALRIEQRLLALPEESGVVFVGVEVEPKNDIRTYPLYKVCVGCKRGMDLRVMKPLVQHTLIHELDPLHLHVEAKYGNIRINVASSESA